MAFSDIARRLSYATGLSQRYQKQDALFRFLSGSFYDDAKLSPFDQEYTGITSGQYIRLRDRRPSVVTNFAGQFVAEVVSLLWADEQFPTIRCSLPGADETDRQTEEAVQNAVEYCRLDEVLSRACYVGSVGSVAVVLRGLSAPDEGEPYFEVWRGYQCIPTFERGNPNRLAALTTIYPVLAEQLVIEGHDIPAKNRQDTYWVRIDLTPMREQRYKPMVSERFQRLGEKEKGVVIAWEPTEAYEHGFGIVPAVWAKAPNSDSREIDGSAIFGAAVDTIIEIDYQLSQIGRAYKYTADPLLAITRGEISLNAYDPSGSKPSRTQTDESGALLKSATNVLDVPAGGKAELLEIDGSGLDAALAYVAKLREYALESIGGMKSDAETQKGAQSGKALEMLYQALVLVVKRARLAWGNGLLLPLVKLIARGIEVGEIAIPGVPAIDSSLQMRLVWPSWMTPVGAEMLSTAQAWQSLAGGSSQSPVDILPREIVTRIAATNLGLKDAESIVAEVARQDAADKADQAAKDAAALKAASVMQNAAPAQPENQKMPENPSKSGEIPKKDG